MPSLTINGHSVTVDDSFDKLSPEEQNATVDHIAAQLHSEEKPSGLVAGLGQGLTGVASGVASTLGLGGVKSDVLNDIASKGPKDYKAAHLIREGGHWYNPSDYQPSALPQVIAEQAPGLASDIIAAKTGAAVGGRVGGTRGSVIGGLGGGLGSMLLRTFGPGAHENAKARTGDENASVSGGDMAREGVKQALTAPLAATGLGRFLPAVTGKAAGVGLEGAGNALKKYLATVGVETATGGGRDAANQAVTNVGQENGVPFDPNRTAEAAIASGATSGALVAPSLAGNIKTASKFREFGGDNAEAATALANRQIEAADGQKLIGPLGGTKVAGQAVKAAHAAVKTELADAAKGETLSTDNANTLKLIQGGGKVSKSALDALSSEASPETMHLARQALLSSKLKGMGELTDDGKFNGGLSGLMEQKLRPLYNPVATGASALAATIGAGPISGMIGMSAPHVLGAVYGSYAAARALDKLTGARSPAKGFTDKFADPNAAIRTPVPQAPAPEPVTTSVPQVSPPQNTQLWGTVAPKEPTLRATLNANAKVEEGMARLVKQVAAGSAKQKAAALAASATSAPSAENEVSNLRTDAPASPEIGALLTKLQSRGAMPAAPAQTAPAPVMAPPAAATAAPEMNGTPAAPLIAKISKKLNGNGKVEETPHAPEEQPYAPIAEADLWRKQLRPPEGVTQDQAVAEQELANYAPIVREKYSKNVISNRANKRDIAETIANAHSPEDAQVAADMYHQLDHISRRAEARRAITYYAGLLSPDAAKAVRSHFTPKVMEKMWKSE